MCSKNYSYNSSFHDTFQTERRYLEIRLFSESTNTNQSHPAGIYLLKVNNRNTRTRCEICSNLTIKIPERHDSHFPAFGLNKERYFVLLKTLCYLKWWSPQLLTWIYISFIQSHMILMIMTSSLS